MNAKETISVIPLARPSIPSVRFTALLVPAINITARNTNTTPGKMIRLFDGFHSPDATSNTHVFRPGRLSDRLIISKSSSPENFDTPWW